MSLPLQRCSACGRRFFPPRLLCPCGGREFSSEQAERGTLEERTAVRRAPGRTLEHPVRVATIAIGDVRVIARLERDAADGDVVELSLEDGAPVAR
jgi:uncharacterized OB-fold protein